LFPPRSLCRCPPARFLSSLLQLSLHLHGEAFMLLLCLQRASSYPQYPDRAALFPPRFLPSPSFPFLTPPTVSTYVIFMFLLKGPFLILNILIRSLYFLLFPFADVLLLLSFPLPPLLSSLPAPVSTYIIHMLLLRKPFLILNFLIGPLCFLLVPFADVLRLLSCLHLPYLYPSQRAFPYPHYLPLILCLLSLIHIPSSCLAYFSISIVSVL